MTANTSRVEWIACIAVCDIVYWLLSLIESGFYGQVSRLMMNIRGLKFDDPHGTIGVQFSTLQFQKHNNAEDKDDPSITITEQ